MRVPPKRYHAVPYTDVGPNEMETVNDATKTGLLKALRAKPRHHNFAVIYAAESDAPKHPVGVAIRGGVGWTVRFVR